MVEILSTIATAIGVPLLLASIALFLAGYLGKEIGIGPVKAPAPEPGKRARWIRAAVALFLIGLTLLTAAAVTLVRASREGNTVVPPVLSPTAVVGTGTRQFATPTSAPTVVTPAAFAGDWRNRQASAGDLLVLKITVTGATTMKVSGSYQDRIGVIVLSERDGVFANSVLAVSQEWGLGTSVDRLRLSSARLQGANLEVVLEHCVVGMLGSTCTPRTNTLVR